MAGQVVRFPICLRIFQFVVIHTVKVFGIVSKVEIDVFLELSSFFNHRKLTNIITWTTASSSSVKLNHAISVTQDRWIMVESSDKMWSTGEGNGKLLQYSCLKNPMQIMKSQKDRTLKDELLRSEGAQYAPGDQWRNNSRKNEETEPKQKQHPVVDVTDDGSRSDAVKSNIA